jgi:formylglycine-generating enzyme required for sulfatase activity
MIGGIIPQGGLEKVDLDLPVMHISFYEAFAYSEWKAVVYQPSLSGK